MKEYVHTTELCPEHFNVNIKYGEHAITGVVCFLQAAYEPLSCSCRNAQAVMWNRTYGKEKWVSPVDRVHATKLLSTALNAISCKRLVVGHTPQIDGANSECDGRVWRLDVGMSRGMLDAAPCVLEITRTSSGESIPKLLTAGKPNEAFAIPLYV